MYSGEGDLQECIDAIQSQRDVSVKQTIISYKPEKEAHNDLWRSWRDVQYSGDFDFFIKVDADTVITDDNAFHTIGQLFEHDTNVTGIQCPLHDYYSDSFINGMNCFSPVVTFRDTDDDLYCDRVDIGHKTVLRSKDLPKVLNPVGKHCWYSKDVHSFHFGLHRMLKNQHGTLNKVKAVWKNQNDRRRGLALLGANVAKKWDNSWGFNYGDPEFEKAFESAINNYDELIEAL